MRRVRDDDVRLRHFLHHAAHGHLALFLANLALDLRIAFRLLELILDFLLRHHQVLRRLPFLIAVIEQRDDEDDADDLEGQCENDVGNLRERRREVVEDELRHRENLILEIIVDEEADDGNLQQRFHELDERALRKHAADAVDRVEVVELRLELLRAENQARLREVDSEADRHDGEHDRHRRLRDDDDDTDEERQHILDIDRLIQMAEDVDRVPCNRVINLLPEHLDDREANQQHERRTELLALADLAFLGCVGTLLGRRLLGLVAICEALQVKAEPHSLLFFRSHSKLPAIAEPARQSKSFHTFHQTCHLGTSHRTAGASRGC